MKMRKKMSNKSRKAQLTIFVILALAIVAIILILIYPRMKDYFVGTAPGDLIPRDCVKNAVFESLNETMLRGGSLKPQLYFMYNNYTVEYSCYTSDWYKTCVMQKPFLKESVQAEVNKAIQSKVQICFNQMESSLKTRGYEVQSSGSRAGLINILPDKINFSIDLKMTLIKNEESFAFDSKNFKFEFPSKSYDLLIIATSIQNYEARYGDSAPEIYMNYYPFIKVEKKKFDDGTKVYILTERNTGEVLQFATRSLAWPPGWALPPSFAGEAASIIK
jgi:hypothetical protein